MGKLLMWKIGRFLLLLIICAAVFYFIFYIIALLDEKKKRKLQKEEPDNKQKSDRLTAKLNGKNQALAFVLSFFFSLLLNNYLPDNIEIPTSNPGDSPTTDIPSDSPATSYGLNVGDTVTLGSFSVEENSPRENWPAIEWIVIEIDGDKARLLSIKGLIYKPYEEVSDDATIWLDSSIRKWLNGYFYEKALNKAPFVLPTTSYTFSRSYPETKYKSEDYVYLLSKDDVRTLLSDEIRICAPTADSVSSFNGQEIHMDGDTWYLREQGEAFNFVSTVNRYGELTAKGSTNYGGGVLIRPCITISISGGFNYLVIEKAEATSS